MANSSRSTAQYLQSLKQGHYNLLKARYKQSGSRVGFQQWVALQQTAAAQQYGPYAASSGTNKLNQLINAQQGQQFHGPAPYSPTAVSGNPNSPHFVGPSLAGRYTNTATASGNPNSPNFVGPQAPAPVSQPPASGNANSPHFVGPQAPTAWQRFRSQGWGGKITSAANAGTTGIGYLQQAMDNPNALIAAGKKQGGGWGTTKELGGYAAKALHPDSTAAQSIGAGMRGVGTLAGKIPVVGKPIEAITKFGAVLVESVDKLRTWTNKLHESNMQFADFSASMAAVKAEADARDVQLKREQGDARSGSAKRLAEAKSAADRSWSPTENLWANIKNDFGEKLSQVREFLGDMVGPVSKAAAKYLEYDEDKAEPMMDLDEWMVTARGENEQWFESYGRNGIQQAGPNLPGYNQGGGDF